MTSSRRTYVLDTSVLLSEPQALRQFEEHAVILPLVVLTELEAKRNHPELGWAARTALRSLEELRERHASLLEELPVNEHGGTIRVELNHTSTEPLPEALRSEANDHRILTVAHNLAREGLDVTLVTKDLPLRLKAGVVGLDAAEYRDTEVADGSWTGFTDLAVESAVVDDEVCCASCKSMPHLATVRCVRCWSENEKLEVQKAIARARAEGKSVAGAAFAMLGGGRKHGGAFTGAGGEKASDRYRARRDVARPVYCLRHGMEGCSHAPACRVLEVKQDVDAIKAVMEALR